MSYRRPSRQEKDELVEKWRRKPREPILRILRNAGIFLVAAAIIILVSILLRIYGNEALGWIAIPALLVLFVAPLARRIRQPGKLFTVSSITEAAVTVSAGLVYMGLVWGGSRLFHYFNEDWDGIGGLVGGIGVPVVVLGAFYLVRLCFGGQIRQKYREQTKLKLYQQVVQNPGISHTALLRSIAGFSLMRSIARTSSPGRLIQAMVREKRIRCERRGRARRYYIQS